MSTQLLFVQIFLTVTKFFHDTRKLFVQLTLTNSHAFLFTCSDESIREVIRSPAVQALISDKIDEVFSTPEGLVLGLVVSKDKVKQNIMPSIENAGKDIVPLVSQLIRNSEVNFANDF